MNLKLSVSALRLPRILGKLSWRAKPSPLVQMSLALVSICGMLLVLADVLLGVFPSHRDEQLKLRKQVGEAVAVQVATLLKARDPAALQATLRDVVSRTPGVRSVALRRADGELVLKGGDHEAAWKAQSAGGASMAERIDVPMQADGRRWGNLEIAFDTDKSPWWKQLLREPLLVTMAFVGSVGLLVFSLYMRRVLQHLDPSQVIPERVQGAFDAMTEGVAVLDAQGRLLLTNRSFKALNAWAAQVRAGQALSQQEWLVSGLGPLAATHPWMRAMGERAAVSGQTLQIEPAPGQVQHLVVNASPVLDGAGRARGCLVTFSDMTALQRSNQSLREALNNLSASQEQVKHQNEELKRLATRDPMTGAFNRRAFNESWESMFASACNTRLALSVLVLDIDFFKKVNDTHGHGVGDRVIQEVAKLLQASVRPVDMVCRYGGEEFVVALPGLDAGEAQQVAERIRQAIEIQCGPAVKEVPGMRVTASIGVAQYNAEARTSTELLDQADQALYAAKKGGRNRVCAHGSAAAALAEVDG
ncbi:MAG: diguanylate cyclase [Rubrivivax sp.]